MFQQKTLTEVFPGVAALPSLPVFARTDNHPDVPELDGGHEFDDATRLVDFIGFLAGKTAQKNLWISGPTGSGKSSFARQVAARLGIPSFEMGCHGGTETPDIMGRVEPTLSGLAWVDGPLLAAMRQGGICLLDEYDLLHPTVAMSLNKALDTRRYNVPATGELVKAHPLFRVVATSNSKGGGDASGQYRAVQTQNAAQRQRWAYMEIGYMTAEAELRLLQRADEKGELPDAIKQALISLADSTRKLFHGESTATESTPLGVVISTRTLVNITRDVIALRKRPDMIGQNALIHALHWNVLDGADPADKEAILGIWKRMV